MLRYYILLLIRKMLNLMNKVYYRRPIPNKIFPRKHLGIKGIQRYAGKFLTQTRPNIISISGFKDSFR